jgi:methyl-accepting chemotaxis protein
VVTAIQSIGTPIQRVNEIAAAIAAAVEEQGAGTREIARNVQQASQRRRPFRWRSQGGVVQSC